MKFVLVLLLSVCMFCHPLEAAEPDALGPGYWPQWRGPFFTGSVPTGNTPVEWSETKNIRWKLPMSGVGFGTPVIWGNDLFVTAAVPPDGRVPGEIPPGPVKFMIMAVDRMSGTIRWERVVAEQVPHEKVNVESSWTAASPIVDGKHVYAYFGSYGIYCLTLDGDPVWEKDLGDMRTRSGHGEGSTPALYKNRLVVNWDHEDQSFIVMLDALNGNEIWRKDREEDTSWMTPLVVEVNGRPQVITSGTTNVRSYDLETGELVWTAEGLTKIAIPSPLAADGVVYVTSGFEGNFMRAIRLADARGDVSGTPALLWEYNRDSPYVPSPMLHDGLLYFNKHVQGILTCIDVATGKPHYQNKRLKGIKNMYASPVDVGDRIYIMSRTGTTLVIKHGPEFSVLATNELDDKFDASPAVAGDELYLRGHKFLYCIAH
ncbi:PQQ-binding-like beta-propeller repeat protein [Candidatus Latescibacterota bacterium]